MNPSVEQLKRWSRASEDGSEVIVPSSAWIDVLWILATLEKMEGNPAVESAFANAAEHDTGRTALGRWMP